MKAIDNNQLAQRLVGFLIVFFAASKRPSGMFDDLKLNCRPMHVLCTLRYHPNRRMTMSQLAADLQMSKQQLSKLVSALESKGLVLREHDLENRRRVYVQITEQGGQEVEEVVQGVIGRIAEDMDVFNEEEKQRFASCIGELTGFIEKLEWKQW
ncbi:MarR family winged helix-turn-helix transcriptional regulator [Candidatus Soleaferrea massiliensis]|uniref:MarR family winged helix-turn-helix transcriptional regulator n=1 Tax=Candidatus Soleaferrea massiliensis TaxID=1470354 RepID=UPI000693C7A0|nr:MarR family transcriptional regulator [Candidatus Soleaferrea massiliensis]